MLGIVFLIALLSVVRYDLVTANKICDSVDLAILLDITTSQEDRIQPIQESLGSLLREVLVFSPYSRFSFSTFTDKPITPLGWNDPKYQFDFCLNPLVPFNKSIENLEEILKQIKLGGGFDAPEAQFDALYRAALRREYEWRSESRTSNGAPIKRVILILTDQVSHTPKDLEEALLGELGKNNLEPDEYSTGAIARQQIIDGPDANYRCNATEYPTSNDMEIALKEKNIIPAFIVSEAVYRSDLHESGFKVFPNMEELAVTRNNPIYENPQLGIIEFYNVAMREWDVQGHVEQVDLSFSNFADKFRKLMKEIGVMCEDDSTITTKTPDPDNSPTACPDCGCCSGCCNIEINIAIETCKSRKGC